MKALPSWLNRTEYTSSGGDGGMVTGLVTGGGGSYTEYTSGMGWGGGDGGGPGDGGGGYTEYILSGGEGSMVTDLATRGMMVDGRWKMGVDGMVSGDIVVLVAEDIVESVIIKCRCLRQKVIRTG